MNQRTVLDAQATALFFVTTYIIHHEGCNGTANFIVGLRSPRRSQQYEQKSAKRMKEEEEESEKLVSSLFRLPYLLWRDISFLLP